ncbi:MAG TPA: Cro/CI family transcriptional regulator [Verrucomicrobiae bacterium]|nr:Cro/CI family transcriptional regulator [Verrucomicrobiae bacterium]
MSGSGHIYFLRHGDFVKIGFSTNYLERCAAISVCTPEETTIIAAHAGTYADEARFHRLLKAHHHRAEWFHWTPEVEALAVSGLPFEAGRSSRTRSAALDTVRERISGKAIAKALNTTPQAISQWNRVPVLRVLDVERITGVPRHELRPDIYPAPTQAEQAAE